MRLADLQSVEAISEDFDNDIHFINSIVTFLKDIGWVVLDQTSGLYKMTEAGKMKSHASKMVIWPVKWPVLTIYDYVYRSIYDSGLCI